MEKCQKRFNIKSSKLLKTVHDAQNGGFGASELRLAHAYHCYTSELIKKRNMIRRDDLHDLSGLL
jgi:hypothetical protein